MAGWCVQHAFLLETKLDKHFIDCRTLWTYSCNVLFVVAAVQNVKLKHCWH